MLSLTIGESGDLGFASNVSGFVILKAGDFGEFRVREAVDSEVGVFGGGLFELPMLLLGVLSDRIESDVGVVGGTILTTFERRGRNHNCQPCNKLQLDNT